MKKIPHADLIVIKDSRYCMIIGLNTGIKDYKVVAT